MRRPHLPLIGLLLILPASLIAYRVIRLGYPLLPSVPGKALKILFEGAVRGIPDQETVVRVALPRDQAGLVLIEEQVESGPLGFSISHGQDGRWGIWSGKIEEREVFISYSGTMVRSPSPRTRPDPPTLGEHPQGTEAGERVLARRMAARWKGLDPPAKLRVVREAMQGRWAQTEPSEADLASWREVLERRGRIAATLLLLRASDLPSRVAEGLRVKGNVVTWTTPWLEVWTGRAWERMEVETLSPIPSSETTIALSKDGRPTLEVAKGEVSQVSWTVTRERLVGWRAHFERTRTSSHFLDRWSLFNLPEQFQETFRILLLVPLGALMICVLRNIVGFPTFGIFMPVLMALAFRNTGLGYGLTLFAGIVLLGYLIRRFLEGLRLLLVPRLSAILTVVIVIFTAVALAGNRLGQRELMAVGLIPFVILTMTIERLFVIAEEAGTGQALRTAAGSAAVASLTYQLLDWDPLQLTFFVYPELLLMVAGVEIMVGRYTGYRLSEIIRFRILGRA